MKNKVLEPIKVLLDAAVDNLKAIAIRPNSPTFADVRCNVKRIEGITSILEMYDCNMAYKSGKIRRPHRNRYRDYNDTFTRVALLYKRYMYKDLLKTLPAEVLSFWRQK